MKARSRVPSRWEIRISPEASAVAMRSPSGCHATPVTARAWSVMVVMGSAVWGFQMMQVRSLLLVATRVSSGLQATPVTAAVCPVRVRSLSRV